MKQYPLESLRKLVEKPIIDMGYTLASISVEKEEAYKDREVIVIYIDKPEGVTIDDCVKVHRRLNPILDETDVIKDSYIISVSSIPTDNN